MRQTILGEILEKADELPIEEQETLIRILPIN